MKKIESKLIELKEETATEYLQPLHLLEEKHERKLKVANIRRDLKLELIHVGATVTVTILLRYTFSGYVVIC